MQNGPAPEAAKTVDVAFIRPEPPAEPLTAAERTARLAEAAAAARAAAESMSVVAFNTANPTFVVPTGEAAANTEPPKTVMGPQVAATDFVRAKDTSARNKMPNSDVALALKNAAVYPQNPAWR